MKEYSFRTIGIGFWVFGFVLGAGALALAGAGSATAASQTPLTVERIVSGLKRPVFVTASPGDTQRLFILEQKTGRILVMKDRQLLAQPFLHLGSKVGVDGNERGLLGLAFDPNYATNGRFFVNYTDLSGDTVVERYVAPPDSDTADATSGAVVLRIEQPFGNHNGGMLAFGPQDGFLYISSGDGGSGFNPGNEAQDLGSLLGKILRIDVSGAPPYVIPTDNPFANNPEARPEIWSFGLRNPWRFSFDRLTGDLYIGDVGQMEREEINLQASDLGGENYGWRCMEGNLCTGLSGCICNAANLTLPIFDYSHDLGCSVTGGYVYRGCAIGDLQGTYFFADYCTNRIWSMRQENGKIVEMCDRTEELKPKDTSYFSISSFGEDALGELYIVDLAAGSIYQIVPEPSQAPDCNGNGIADGCDISLGTSIDDNVNGVPDECELIFSQGPIIRGQSLTFRAEILQPGETVYFLYSFAGIGAGPCFFEEKLCLDLLEPFGMAGTGIAGGDGVAELTIIVPADSPLVTVYTQAAVIRGAGGVASVKSMALSAVVADSR